MRRVVVTGIGLVTPLGNNVDSTWTKIKNGITGFGFVEFNGKFPFKAIAGRVRDFVVNDYVKHNDRFIQFAFSAAEEAIKDSDLKINAERTGCVVSSSKGGMEVFSNGKSENFLENFLPHMAASTISKFFNLAGPIEALSCACATGGYSIVEGIKFIEEDRCDMVIAGSSEASIVPLIIAGFDKLGVLSMERENIELAILPFDKRRSGFVISEGAGILVLEELQHAINRSAKIYCEITGYAVTSDAYHIASFNPCSESIVKAINLSLKKANLTHTDIDYINAHGTGTIMNDKLETKAIKNSFGEYAKNLSISSTKSMTGHLLGASGSVEFIFSILAMRDNFVPPTVNLEISDPECDLDYTPNKGIQKRIKNVMSLSFGFGGNVVSLIGNSARPSA